VRAPLAQTVTGVRFAVTITPRAPVSTAWSTHVVGLDPSVGDVLDLQPNEEAERISVGGPWTTALIDTGR
jgi:hypothetical protein